MGEKSGRGGEGGAKEGRPLPIRISGYATAGPLARKYLPDFPYS